MIEEHGEQFSESNVTNSFIALAKVADGKGLDEESVHGNRSFQMLVGDAADRLPCDPASSEALYAAFGMMLAWLDAPQWQNADMVLLGIRRYSSKQLLSVVGSAAKLGFDDDMLMDTITSRLLKQVETLDAAQLVDLVSKTRTCCLCTAAKDFHGWPRHTCYRWFHRCRSLHWAKLKRAHRSFCLMDYRWAAWFSFM